MNPRALAAEIDRKGRPKKRRAGHGQWVTPARAVFNLVEEKGWNVSEAVREVVEQYKFPDARQAFNGVRAAYYVIKDRLPKGFDI